MKRDELRFGGSAISKACSLASFLFGILALLSLVNGAWYLVAVWGALSCVSLWASRGLALRGTRRRLAPALQNRPRRELTLEEKAVTYLESLTPGLKWEAFLIEGDREAPFFEEGDEGPFLQCIANDLVQRMPLDRVKAEHAARLGRAAINSHTGSRLRSLICVRFSEKIDLWHRPGETKVEDGFFASLDSNGRGVSGVGRIYHDWPESLFEPGRLEEAFGAHPPERPSPFFELAD